MHFDRTKQPNTFLMGVSFKLLEQLLSDAFSCPGAIQVLWVYQYLVEYLLQEYCKLRLQTDLYFDCIPAK